jgi:replicative DNA helicase
MQRMLPSNIDAECAVLGSLIIDPEAIVHILDFLRPDDFYRDAHRTLFETILTLYHRRTPADFITICDELERQNMLGNIGGASYITSLINGVPTSGNIEYYGRIVERTGVLRRLIQSAGRIAAIAYEATEETADMTLEQAEELIFAVRQSHLLGQAKSPLLRDALGVFFERLEQLSQQRGTLSGVPTGFTDLDRLLGGLQRSDLIILAARPAIGKSACALSIAHNAAVRHRQRIGIFSLEMSQEQMVQRLVSMDARIDQQRLRTGWIEDHEWERIVEAMGTLSEATILIDDTAGISALQLRSKARQWVAEYGSLDLIIVDYLQLMRVADGAAKRSDNRVQIVDEIASELKALARELNIPVLALAQLSRAVEQRHSKVPQLSDLRESGGLEQTADVVLFIYRDEVYNPETERRNQADIIVAKHRNGPVGEVVLYFERSQTRFRDLEVSPPAVPMGTIVESVVEEPEDDDE